MLRESKIQSSRDILVPALSFALFFALAQGCFAQASSCSVLRGAPHDVNGNKMTVGSMVLVRGASFQMGIDAAQIPSFQKIFDIDRPQLFQDEVPKHWVSMDDFYIDKYPVTNAQFKIFTDANPEWQLDHIPREIDNGRYLKHWKEAAAFITKADHPVVNVNWYAAVAYCRWAGKRLPTEGGGENAARGGLNALFPWGNQPGDGIRPTFSGSGFVTTSPVGKIPRNSYELFAMAGMVWHFLAH